MSAETGMLLYLCIFFGTIIGCLVVKHMIDKKQEN